MTNYRPNPSAKETELKKEDKLKSSIPMVELRASVKTDCLEILRLCAECELNSWYEKTNAAEKAWKPYSHWFCKECSDKAMAIITKRKEEKEKNSFIPWLA